MSRRRASPTPSEASAPRAEGAPTTAALAEAGWVLPWAMEPQTGGDGGVVGARSATTPVGTLDRGSAATLDQRGLLVLGSWSLDWWIGADDRWHLPAREAAVRQHLIGSAPVVETLVRVPGGDAVQRVYGMRGAPHPGGDEYLVVELENRSRIPLAAVVAVRPFTASGVGEIGSISVEAVPGASGRDIAHMVRLDGRPAIVLPRRPARAAGSTAADGDVATTVLAGDAPEALPSVACPDAMASAAFVFPVPHTVALRVVLPIGCGADAAPVSWPPVIPTAEQVVSGWVAQSRPGVRWELPDPRLADAVTASRRYLMLDRLAPPATSGADWQRAAALAGTAGRLGRSDEVRRALRHWPGAMADTVAAADDRSAGAALARVAVGHWRLTRDDAAAEEVLPELAAHVERVGRDHRRGRLRSDDDRRLVTEAMADVQELLAGLHQADAAERVGRLAARLRDGGSLTPSSDGPVPADDRTPGSELARATTDVARGDVAAVDRLAWVLEAASPTWTWPTSGAPGHDLAVSASLVDLVRDLLVREDGDGLALLSVLPLGWYGGGIEVHDAPTGCGLVSFAVRWHGERPALLWDLRPHPGLGPVQLTSPGLDPTWSTVEPRGDALLSAVPAMAAPR